MSNILLQNEIIAIIDKRINEYISNIAYIYDLDENELKNIWYEEPKINNKVSEPKINNKVSEPKINNKVSEPKINKNSCSGCPYIFTKGVNSGEICGSKPKNGATYCSKHKKYEGMECHSSTKKKLLPVTKKSIVPVVKKVNSCIKKPNLILIRHKKINKFIHPESGLVFKSDKEKIVIGKLHDDKIIDLDESDIDNCKKYGFKFDNTPKKELKNNLENEELENEELQDEELEDEELEDEELEDEELEKVVTKNSVRKITKSLHNDNEVKNMKKSINQAINYTNSQAEDVEDILNKLNIKTSNSDSEEEFEQVSDEEFEEEFEEEF